MNTNQVNCFMCAAKHLNFTAAAEELFISQPALSRNIQALEDEFGVLLFSRKNNVITLTAGGEIMLEWMKKTNHSLEVAVKKAVKANKNPSGELRVGFTSTEFPSKNEADVIVAFRNIYPEINLTIQHFPSVDLVQKLEDHEIDIALTLVNAVNTNPRLEYIKSSTYKRVAAIPAGHPLCDEKEISLIQLKDETFLSIIKDASPRFTANIEKMCQSAGFTPVIHEYSSSTELTNMLEAGKGVSILYENHYTNGNSLICLKDLKENLTVDLVCAWDKLNLNPAVSSYLDLIKSNQ